eukprot:c10338_g1_i1.p1 GENE.c10338_g1_i1~~c10338_g1_i1.p1  ORF type:complete len:464 (+),score=78.44 c10338_g1_i1:53-1393(+)
MGDHLLVASPHHHSYPVEKRRWIVLLAFCLLTAENAVMWISFSPIQERVQDYYGVSKNSVNTLSVVFLALYIPSTVLSVAVFHWFGMRSGLMLGATLNSIGSVIRYVSTDTDHHPRFGENGYTVLLIGQLFPAISQPFFVNLPAMLAMEWFPVSERDIAVVIGSMFNIVGIAAGQAVPPIVVNTDSGMPALLFGQMLMCLGTWVFCLLTVKAKPSHAPSKGAEQLRHGKVEHSIHELLSDMWLDAKTCLSDRNYLRLTFAFGTGLGLFNGLSTLIVQFVEPCGYGDNEAGWYGMSLIVAGLVMSGIVGVFLEMTHQYNRTLRVLFLCATLSFVFLAFSLRRNNNTMLIAAFAILGLFMMPLVPVSFECAVECTYPIREDVSTGIMLCVGQITGIVFIYGWGDMLTKQHGCADLKIWYVWVAMAIVAVLLGVVWGYNGPYKRTNADN